MDETDVRAFLRNGYPRLVAAVTLVCGSRAAAEDSVLEALARAWELTERGKSIHTPEAWITHVALNLSRSEARRVRAEQRARERLSQVGTVARSEVSSAELIDVRAALAALPHRQRQAVVLRYYLGMKVPEIARTLEVAEGTVKTALFRARDSLARALKAVAEEETDVIAD